MTVPSSSFVAVVDPLPDLAARDLHRRGVLQLVVEDDGAAAAEPEGEVLEADADVGAQTRLGHLARGRGQIHQRLRVGDDVVAATLDLVRALAQHRVEGGRRHADDIWVGNPGAVEAVARLALLVGAHGGDARSVAFGSVRLGISAAKPPIAKVPRPWQVRTSSSV